MEAVFDWGRMDRDVWNTVYISHKLNDETKNERYYSYTFFEDTYIMDEKRCVVLWNLYGDGR
jgi:hypothetical protein